jgi:hypothetical protein
VCEAYSIVLMFLCAAFCQLHLFQADFQKGPLTSWWWIRLAVETGTKSMSRLMFRCRWSVR